MFHDHPCFTLDGFELLCQCHQILGTVAHIEGQLHNLAKRPRHGHGALSDGNINTCIAIRTVLFRNQKAYVQAGAGIVADSVPENEYYETVNKALAVLNAVKEAGK